MLIKQFHTTRRSFPCRASRRTKTLYCHESDRATTKTRGEVRSGCISANDSNSRKPRSFGERTRDETLETRRKNAAHEGQTKGRGGKRREGRKRMVPVRRLQAERAKDGGGSWLKRQYRRKLIIGVRCTREENKIQASSDCCFQLNPSCATLST